MCVSVCLQLCLYLYYCACYYKTLPNYKSLSLFILQYCYDGPDPNTCFIYFHLSPSAGQTPADSLSHLLAVCVLACKCSQHNTHAHVVCVCVHISMRVYLCTLHPFTYRYLKTFFLIPYRCINIIYCCSSKITSKAVAISKILVHPYFLLKAYFLLSRTIKFQNGNKYVNHHGCHHIISTLHQQGYIR